MTFKRIFLMTIFMWTIFTWSLVANTAHAAQSYADWVKYLKVEAQRRNVKQSVIDDAFAHINLKIPNKKIVRSDQSQPEMMQTFFSYYDGRITAEFISEGKQNYAKYKDFLQELEKKYNVQGEYIIALWGMESRYGKIKGRHNILNATATLSYTRRQNFFTLQFFTALQIMEKYNRSAEEMMGSWASAMGHMQFIPTTLHEYGVDGDSDGKLDIWNNEYDAFASAANYLYKRGWKADKSWGREVLVPRKFDYSLANIKKKHSLKYWRKKKVRRLDGRKVPNDSDLKAALLIPAGAKGPKFLIYDNFYRFLNWNYSRHNALTIGLLGDLIAGRKVLQKNYDVDHNALKREYVVNTQIYLNQLGYKVGKPDGKFGSKSRKALKKYQKNHKLPVDGYLDINIYQRLKQDADKIASAS